MAAKWAAGGRREKHPAVAKTQRDKTAKGSFVSILESEWGARMSSCERELNAKSGPAANLRREIDGPVVKLHDAKRTR